MRFEAYERYLRKLIEVRSKVVDLNDSVGQLIAIADDHDALSFTERNSLLWHGKQLDNTSEKLYNKKHLVEP